MPAIFIQYTNPGAYPPIINGSRMLNKKGVPCHFFGIERTPELIFDPNESWRATTLWREQKSGPIEWVTYGLFLLAALARGLMKPGAWLYFSDPPTAPAALAATLLGCKVIYHEHDAPDEAAPSVRNKLYLLARRHLVSRVQCVAPSQERAALLDALGAKRITVVPNCPSLHELEACRKAIAIGTYVPRLVYQGTIVPDRLPATILHAIARLPSNMRPLLVIIGYTTISGQHHLEELLRTAVQLGIDQHLRVIGPLPRHTMLAQNVGPSVGLSLVPTRTEEPNMATMPGASNKPFDYLCQGLVPLCTDNPQWRQYYGNLAEYCDPNSADSIAEALMSLFSDEATLKVRMHAGQDAIEAALNYDMGFREIEAIVER